MKAEIRASVSRHVGLALDDVVVGINDTPASWVMEGGDIMPEPGDEAAWLAAHAARKPAVGL